VLGVAPLFGFCVEYTTGKNGHLWYFLGQWVAHISGAWMRDDSSDLAILNRLPTVWLANSLSAMKKPKRLPGVGSSDLGVTVGHAAEALTPTKHRLAPK